MMGFGDVASILIPAVKLVRQQYADSGMPVDIDVMTYGAGIELMALSPEVNNVLAVSAEQWPDDLGAAIQSFMNLADVVVAGDYERIINLDTWFMPCFLARVLKDLELPLEGNFISLGTAEFFQKLQSNTLTQDYFAKPGHYLQSSFVHMADWTLPWWDKYPAAGAYPQFYLNHCCGFTGELDSSLDFEIDSAARSKVAAEFKAGSLKAGTHVNKIIALSTSGSKANKQYPHDAALKTKLQQMGFFVWGQFDGSVPMATTLQRLRMSDLLITVPTSTQWLAKLVGCPSLMIPGALPPSVLGAELTVAKSQDCQYCYQNDCPAKRNYACMNIAVEEIAEMAGQFLGKC